MKPTWFKITNSAESDHAEILIYEQIGKDWWDDSGVDAKSFAEELSNIPRNRKINLRINSPGGNVWDGLAIYNLLKERKAMVECDVDGIAASIASIIALAAGKVRIPKNGLFMIHKPLAVCAGNAEDMEKTIKVLDKHEDSLVSIYKEETDQPEESIRQKMSDETWFTGEEAVAFGLADELTEEVKIAASFDFSRFRNTPKAISGDPANSQTHTNQMKRTPINLNPQTGETVGGGGAAPAAKPVTAETDSNILAMRQEIALVNSKLEAARRSSVEKSIDALVGEGRIEAGTREFWLKTAIADETVIENLKKNPVIQPAQEPVGVSLEIKSESIQDIGVQMAKIRAPQDSFRRGNDVKAQDLRASAQAAADFHWNNRPHMQRILNANTIGADLKRNVILQEVVRAFAIKLAPLRAFSTVFNAQRLEGTDKVAVPYFPLVGTASTDFVAANGYVMGDSAQDDKDVTIDKRKYQPIRFDSSEIARQPALNLMQIAVMKAEKLAVDVFANVLSVVTNANYGAAALVGAAGTFDAADVVDLKGVADTANWPTTNRSLIIKSAYDVNLLKANVITATQLSWQNYGSVSPIQDGIVPRLAGFDIYTTEQIPANGENLTGLICTPSAVLVATSPINPAEEVRSQLSKYEIVVHPTLGIGFEYRCWGNPDFDQRREIIECNYGFAVGEAAGLERITSA